MEENIDLILKVQDISKEAFLLEEKINSLFDSLPRKSRCRIIDAMKKYYIDNASQFHYHILLQEYDWRVETIFNAGTTNATQFALIVRENWGRIDDKVFLYSVLNKESDWRVICSFIVNALDNIKRAFDSCFQEEVKHLEPDIIELSGTLREAREEIRRQAEEKMRLLEERNSFKDKMWNFISERSDLMFAIKQSIPQLQKAVQDLKNTRSFLGQSKTIKGIRENIEKVINDLLKVAYPNESHGSTSTKDPSWRILGI
jgi:hypothetical protein